MDKNPGTAKMIPGFIYGMLRQALELYYTNEILHEHGHRQGLDFADACTKKFNVTINKHGAQAMEKFQKIYHVYSCDNQVITFPAGLFSRRKKGVIIDTLWQKSFITKAVKFQRDIVRMHITGRCRNNFYNLSNLRKFLGLKANHEMYFLPKETYQHKNTEYSITYGNPLSWEVFDKPYNPIVWAERVKQHCYSLTDDKNLIFKAE